MVSDLLHYLPAALTTFFGGGAAQIMMKVYSRRADLRQINTTSDLNVASIDEKHAAVSERLITQLQVDGDHNRQIVADLQVKVERLEDRAVQVQRENATQLRDAHAENGRLISQLARLETDLDIAKGQIAQLRTRYQPYGPTGDI